MIGHFNAERRMGRNYLKGRGGERANAMLAAAGYNLNLLVRWFEALLRALIAAVFPTKRAPPIGDLEKPRFRRLYDRQAIEFIEGVILYSEYFEVSNRLKIAQPGFFTDD